MNQAITEHVERSLTHVIRHQRLVNSWLSQLNDLYDTLILYRNELADCGALEPLHEAASAMLSYAIEESEVVESIAQSTYLMVKSNV